MKQCWLNSVQYKTLNRSMAGFNVFPTDFKLQCFISWGVCYLIMHLVTPPPPPPEVWMLLPIIRMPLAHFLNFLKRIYTVYVEISNTIFSFCNASKFPWCWFDPKTESKAMNHTSTVRSTKDLMTCNLDFPGYSDRQSHCNEIPIYVLLSWELRGLSPNFHIQVSASDLYIYSQDRSTYSCSRIGRLIVGIYKSLSDTWMWKLGLWPRSSFSGNICFEFLLLVLCSACFLCI